MPRQLLTQVTIRKSALLSALQGAKEMHPDEFIALFRGEEHQEAPGESNGKAGTKSRKKDAAPDQLKQATLMLTELIIPPFAHGDEDSSSYSPYFIPANSREKASFHSHPDPDTAYPSDEDLYYFSKESGIHFIACFPFRLQDVACFDADGNEVEFSIA